MSESGVVKKWIGNRGFGFITYDGGEIFVHVSQVNGKSDLNVGEGVTFDIGQDERSGKDRANNVTGDGKGEPAPQQNYNNYGGGYNQGGGYGGRGGRRNNYGGGRNNYGGGRRNNYGGGNRGGGYNNNQGGGYNNNQGGYDNYQNSV